MGQAIEILGKAVHTRTPESKGIESSSFLQVQKSVDPRTKIVTLLRKAGKKDLTKLADAIAKTEEQPLGTGTFDQIKNMIQKMIFHLMSEQKDEDDHKNWCDTEISKTNKMKDDKEDTEAALTSDINSLTAEIDQLGRDIASNEGSIASLEADVEAETDTRNEEKAENAATVKDAQEAQTAVANAIAVLTDFYKSTGAVDKEAWEALVQMKTVRAHRVSKEEPRTRRSRSSGVRTRPSTRRPRAASPSSACSRASRRTSRRWRPRPAPTRRASRTRTTRGSRQRARTLRSSRRTRR